MATVGVGIGKTNNANDYQFILCNEMNGKRKGTTKGENIKILNSQNQNLSWARLT